MERVENYDISSGGWKPHILPLNYTRMILALGEGIEPSTWS